MPYPITHQQAATLCQAVYAEPHIDLHRVATCSLCGDTDTLDVQARVDIIGDAVAVCIRGTDSFADWMANLDQRPCRIGDGITVANGWRHGAALLLPRVIEALADAGADDRTPLILSGHSKGGAEASILAYLLSEIGYTVTDLVTFGSPPPGRGAFSSWFRQSPIKVSRYVNGLDPVPWFPPRLLGFRHIAPSIQLYPLPWWRLYFGRRSRLLFESYHLMHHYTQRVWSDDHA